MIAIRKKEKISTIFEASKDTDVINKAYTNESLIKTNGHLSL